jgi:long-chain acyl-CoA synthetase
MSSLWTQIPSVHDRVRRDEIALEDEQGSLTYAQLVDQVTEIGVWLTSLRVNVVALYLQNCIEWVLMDLACQEAKLVCVPIPTFFCATQINHCLQQAGVDLLISDQRSAPDQPTEFKSVMRLPSPISSCHVWKRRAGALCKMPRGTQKITFTSGSTGTPKGVCLSVDHQWQVAQSVAQIVNLHRPKHLCLLPLGTLLENIAGLYSPLLGGGQVQLVPQENLGLCGSSGIHLERFLKAIEQSNVESMILMPQMLSLLVGACEQGWRVPDSLSFVAVGGAKVSASLIISANQSGLPVFQGYGLSECGSVVALNTPKQSRVESAGRVLPHCEVEIRPDGEVRIWSACHLGYLNQPESWYPRYIDTGDLGVLDNDFLTLTGRKKNVLITSYGRNVSPEWIESELMATPLLSLCAVIGNGQPFLSALLKVAEEVSDESVGAWIRQVNQALPDYARVAQWYRLKNEIWPFLINPSGKINRQMATQVFQQHISQSECQPAR